MFDPHNLRTNRYRRYQKRGQIIQARKVEIPRTIEHSLIPLYKEYFTKNYITGYVPDQDLNIPPFYIQSTIDKLTPNDGSFNLTAGMSVIYIVETEETIDLYIANNKSSQTIVFEFTGYYIWPQSKVIHFLNKEGSRIFTLYWNDMYDSTEIDNPTISFPKQPGLILNEISS